jgi:hypothetical protein
MEASTALVLSTTVPPFLWLLLRFAAIFHERSSKIVYHVKHDGLVAAAHIILSLVLVMVIPYMIYLNLVPSKGVERVPEPHRLCVRILAYISFFVNISVAWMLPSPARHKQYDMSLRMFVRTLTMHHLGGWQFAAMSLQTVFLLDRSVLPTWVTLGIGLFVIFIYAFGGLLSLFEMYHVAWEDFLLPGFLTHPPASGKMGHHTKSRLVIKAAEMLQQPGGISSMFGALFFVGFIVSTQTLFQLQSIYLELPIWSRMDDFYAVSLLYMTTIQMAGYFILFQPSLKPNNPFDRFYPEGYLDLYQLLLTVIIPVLLLSAGPYWTDLDSSEWAYAWMTWQPKAAV